MLTSLYIKDFALIDELEVQFTSGLTIITGQTGAGKSIIIGALNMVLGERADTDVIRHDAAKAVAEAFFKVEQTEDLKKLFTENELEWQPELVLRREIKASGSRAFVNDTPVPIGVLKAVGDVLVDLHGQHDHQLLLKEEHHRGFLDQFTAIRPILADYLNQLNETRKLHKKWTDLKQSDRQLQEKLDLYRFQLKELQEAELQEGEEDELLQEMNLLDNAEILDQKATAIREIGTDGEINVMDLLAKLEDELEDLSKIDSGFEQFLNEMQAAKISLNELFRFTDSYQSGIEFNPDRLEQLRVRHTELKRLQKKYHRNIEELIALRDELEEQIHISDNFDVELEKLEKNFKASCSVLSEKAQQLRTIRTKTGKDLAQKVVQELHHLGINHAQFEVRLLPIEQKNGWIQLDGLALEANDSGGDHVTFYISTNKGVEPKPLSKTASGGEISRVMLTLKSIFAEEQSLPLMIFDEIDTGISGEISEKVGRSMRKLSCRCQIICITHQSQIAAYADAHFVVQKSESEHDTTTQIISLSESKHVEEIARLMSGELISDASLESARLMISRAKAG
ncbi:DNA repair protein RecN [bacterium]|nr:MAG: DNA repair protein RecN [bacterium]